MSKIYTPSLEQYPTYNNVCINDVIVFKTSDNLLAREIFFRLCKLENQDWTILLELTPILQNQDIGDRLAEVFKLHQI